MGEAATSTPVQFNRSHRRNNRDEMNSSISPIIALKDVDRSDTSMSLNGSVDSRSIQDGTNRTNLSHELAKLLKRPRTEGESQELLSVLQQTIDLTRAAIERGLIRGCRSDPELMINLSRNALFKPVRRVLSASFTALMGGLNIDDWSGRDLTCPGEGVNQLQPSGGMMEIGQEGEHIQLRPSDDRDIFVDQEKYPFNGRLHLTWPRDKDEKCLNVGIENYLNDKVLSRSLTSRGSVLIKHILPTDWSGMLAEYNRLKGVKYNDAPPSNSPSTSRKRKVPFMNLRIMGSSPKLFRKESGTINKGQEEIHVDVDIETNEIYAPGTPSTPKSARKFITPKRKLSTRSPKAPRSRWNKKLPAPKEDQQLITSMFK